MPNYIEISFELGGQLCFIFSHRSDIEKKLEKVGDVSFNSLI